MKRAVFDPVVVLGFICLAGAFGYMLAQRQQDTIWCVDMTKITRGRAILAVVTISETEAGKADCLTMDMSGHSVKSEICQQMAWAQP